MKALLEELGLRGWPKTSGSRGMHVNVRIEPRWTFTEVRRAALALSRAVERRAPALATSKWWKEERHGVFLDYNQNAKDRTTCSAYSVRPLPDARVSTPLRLGRGPRLRAGRLHRADRAGALRGRSAIRTPAWTTRRDRSTRCSSWRPRRSVGPGRRAVAAALPQDGRRGAARAPSRAKGAKGAAKKAPREKMPLIVVANSPSKEAALAGLERWRAKHAEVAKLLAVDDVLVDAMRGRSSTWTRMRINLRHVPEEVRPPRRRPIRTTIRRASGAAFSREARLTTKPDGGEAG